MKFCMIFVQNMDYVYDCQVQILTMTNLYNIHESMSNITIHFAMLLGIWISVNILCQVLK